MVSIHFQKIFLLTIIALSGSRSSIVRVPARQRAAHDARERSLVRRRVSRRAAEQRARV
jgi:hypothetical protein